MIPPVFIRRTRNVKHDIDAPFCQSVYECGKKLAVKSFMQWRKIQIACCLFLQTIPLPEVLVITKLYENCILDLIEYVHEENEMENAYILL
jgi:hypothetical protein